MRKLVWFTLGFCIACGISAYLQCPQYLMLPALILACLSCLLFRKLPAVRKTGLVLLGICAGTFWYARFQTNYLDPVRQLDGITVTTQFRCSDYPEQTDYGNRVTGKITVAQKQYSVMVYLKEDVVTEPGDMISGPFRLRFTAPGGKKESDYYSGEGIFLLAYQDDKLSVTRSQQTWMDIPVIFQQKMLDQLKASLPEDGVAFSRALLFGDSSGLDYATLTSLSVSGVRHIVAVSGLHVSILFGLLGLVTFRKRFLTVLIGVPVLAAFAAMTGFTPSVCRACMMSGLMLLATLVKREYDGTSALAFAALVLLIVNPLVIASVSYQLSFASVAGILFCSPGIRKWLQSVCKIPKVSRLWRKTINGIILSVSVTLGATVATVPLCAVYFGTVSLAAVFTNLLVLWAVSVIFYGLLIVCLLGSIWPGSGILPGRILTFLIRYVLFISDIVSDFPLASVYTKSPYITAWIIFVYVLLAVWLLSHNRKPVELICCMVLSLCVSLLLSWTEPIRTDVRFTVLDVGQGQCLLLQAGGSAYLVDCGGSSDAMAADAAAETLLSQGIAKVDGLILTHYDADHAGGLENLLSRISVDLLILPPVYSDMQLKADQFLYAKEDLTLSSDTLNIQIYSASDRGTANENSLCILFDTENCDILITSDRDGFGERMLLRRTELKDVDVLVAGHHGASDSTCDELLTAVRPEIVCISAGEGNRYGHPAPELIQRLAYYGCTVYRTDLHGDILIRR